MQTIAIVNQKGGVGKSTTAVNLGAGLTRQGKRVLLIDADSQANLTEMLGWQQPDELSPTLATMLERIISDRPIEPRNGILHHKEGMDLLPANIELSGLEVFLVNTMSRETVLRTYLNEIKRQYDYILVDCSPSLGMLTLNALTAAVPLSPRERLGATAPHREQSTAAAQLQPEDQRYPHHDGGQPHEFCKGDQPACAGYLRQGDTGV